MKGRIPPAPVLLLAVVVPLLSLIPTWQGYQAASPPGRVFMGFRYMAGDHFQYAAFIRQAAEHADLLMTNPFTSEPQRGVFILLYFWLLGTSAGLTGLSITAVWEAFRVAGGFLYIILFWYFAGSWLARRGERLFATALFALAGGLDWLVMLARVTVAPGLRVIEKPFDFYWNWSTFGSMLVPNWVWPAMTLMAACHLVVRRSRMAAPATLLLLPVVWFLHAYSGMVAYLAFGLLPLVPLLVAALRVERLEPGRVGSNLAAAAPGLASFLVVAGYLVWARGDPVFRANSAYGLTWTDNFSVWWYPIAYGLLLPLAFFGIRAVSREAGIARDLIFAWLAAAFVLSVNPIYAGVKFQYLMFPPLAILATRGLFHLREISPAVRRAWGRAPVAGLFLMALFLDAPVSLFKDARAAGEDQNIFMAAPEIEAMRWLGTQPDGVVLSGYWAGNRLPWLSGKTVYVGHWFVTIDSSEKTREATLFFSPGVPLAWKRQLLAKTGARYVYAGPRETASGPVDPALPLKRIYDKDGVSIYEVQGAR